MFANANEVDVEQYTPRTSVMMAAMEMSGLSTTN